MAYGSRNNRKKILDSIVEGADGGSIMEGIEYAIQSEDNRSRGRGAASAAKSLEDTYQNVSSMKRSLGEKPVYARSSVESGRAQSKSTSSVAKDWMTILTGQAQSDKPDNDIKFSQQFAERMANPQTADDKYLVTGVPPTVQAKRSDINSALEEAIGTDTSLTQSPDSINTDEKRAEDAQYLSGSGLNIEDRFPDDETATTATTGLMSRPYDADRMKDINESSVFKNYKYNLTNSTNTDNDVKNVQGMLTELGYKAGKADNDLGLGTQRAIRKFQAINGLPISKPYPRDTDPAVIRADYLNAATMAKLKASDIPLAFPDPHKKDAIVTELLDTDLEIFKTEVGKIESNNVYDIEGGDNKHYQGRYQMGKMALEDAGRGYSASLNAAFRSDPDLQDRLFKKYTKKNHMHLTKNSQAYRDMTKEEKLGILGYAHNQGATAAEEYLVTGVSGSDAFGTKGTKYTDALRVAFAEQVRTQSKAQ